VPAPTLTPHDTAHDAAHDAAARLRAAIGKLSRATRPTAAATELGLTPTATSVLLTVVREGPIGLSQIADAEDLNPTMLSRVVADLGEAGLVARRSDPSDARAAIVDATAAGRRLRDRMRRERTDALNVVLNELPTADRRRLQAALPVLESLAESLRDRRR
jgi:DNA-binding MarR family transcriptional regulator